ncbi:MAG: HupE/UreJ family protein [Rhodoferax sp.]
MKANRSTAKRAFALLALGTLGSAAQAHTGHGTVGFMVGAAHPLGLDHLLAMLAVGLWSTQAWPQGEVWKGPAAFMGAMLVAGLLGASGWELPMLEHLIALSVVLFGAMLVLGHRQLPAGLALGVIAVSGTLHGWAHGAEAPQAGFAGYAVGFLVSTAMLHTSGVLVGLGLRKALAERKDWVTPCLGALLGVAGMALLGQV